MSKVLAFVTICLLLLGVACEQQKPTQNYVCTPDSLFHYAGSGNLAALTGCGDAGANLQIVNEYGESLLDLARRNSHDSISAFLKDRFLVDWKANDRPLSSGILIRAIEYDQPEVVLAHLETGVPLNEPILNDMSPLILAIFSDSPAVVQSLLKHGVSPNTVFEERPAISISAMFNQLHTMKMLVEAGASVNEADNVGVTPIMFAAAEGHQSMVQYLLDQGADWQLQDDSGETAIVKAEYRQHQSVVELLTSLN